MILHNPTSEQVLDIIRKKSVSNFDIIINDKNDFRAEIPYSNPVEGKFLFKTSQGHFRPVDSALTQLLVRNKVPAGFFRDCPDHVQRDILEHFCNSKKYMLRCRDMDVCRAVMSTRYAPLDDHEIFPVIIEELSKHSPEYKRFEYDDHLTILQAQIAPVVTGVEGLVSDINVFPAISVTNSETGHSSVWVEPSIGLFNGYYITNRGTLDKYSSRIIHKGNRSLETLREAIEIAKEITQVGVIQLLEASEEEVTPLQANSLLEHNPNFPKRIATVLASEWEKHQRIKKLDVVRRILEAAKDFPLLKKIALQEQAGQYLGVFKNHKSRLDNLVRRANKT